MPGKFIAVKGLVINLDSIAYVEVGESELNVIFNAVAASGEGDRCYLIAKVSDKDSIDILMQELGFPRENP